MEFSYSMTLLLDRAGTVTKLHERFLVMELKVMYLYMNECKKAEL